MLYYLFRFLEQYQIPGSHMWQYISFRSLLTLILSLLISAWFGERFIKYMKRHNFKEAARDEIIDPFGEKKKNVHECIVHVRLAFADELFHVANFFRLEFGSHFLPLRLQVFRS